MPSLDSLQNKHAQEAAARKKVERKGAVRPWENSGPPEPAKTPEATKAAEPARTPEATKAAEPARTPEATKAAEPARTPEATKAAEPARMPEATKAAKTARTPEATKAAEPARTPEATKAAEPARTPEATKAAEPARTPEATKTAKPATMGAGTGKTGEAPKAAVFGASKTDLEIDPDSVALLNMCAKIGAEAAVRYFVLKRIADKSEGILAVSQVAVASLFNISDQSVKRLFAALEEAGLLSLLKDYDPREGSPRIYKFI
jgi:hypothetical protein